MSHDIQQKQLPEQRVATVRASIPVTQIGRFVPDALQMIVTTLGQAGVAPVGMPFVVYHSMPESKTWDVQVCFPIAGPFEGAGDVKAETIPGGTMAFTLHRGRYDEVGRAYEALRDWVQHEHRRFAGPPREAYLNDPQVVGEENALTEIDWPIA